MKNRTVALWIGSLLATGAIVNDALLLDSISVLTWAKVLFLASVPFLLIGGLRKQPIRIVDIMVAGYIFSLIFASLFFSGGGLSKNSLSVINSLVIGGCSFFLISRSWVTLNHVVNCFGLWVVVSVFLALIQSTFGLGFITDRIFSSSVIPGTFRASGLMSDPNYFSMICLIGLVFSYSDHCKFRRFLFYLSVLGVILSGSRSGIIILFAVFLVSGHDKLFSLKSFIAGSLLLFSSFFILYSFRDYLPQSFSMVFDPASYSGDSGRNSLSDRLMAVNAGITAFFEYPYFGYGLGNLVSHPTNFFNQKSHNTFVEILAESGVFGIVAFFLLIFNLISKINLGVHHGDIEYRNSCFMLSMLLMVFLLVSLTVITHYSRIFFFLLAVFEVGTRNRQEI